jgi:hypothetical protein
MHELPRRKRIEATSRNAKMNKPSSKFQLTQILEAALANAERGISVFPCEVMFGRCGSRRRLANRVTHSESNVASPRCAKRSRHA